MKQYERNLPWLHLPTKLATELAEPGPDPRWAGISNTASDLLRPTFNQIFVKATTIASSPIRTDRTVPCLAGTRCPGTTGSRRGWRSRLGYGGSPARGWPWSSRSAAYAGAFQRRNWEREKVAREPSGRPIPSPWSRIALAGKGPAPAGPLPRPPGR